MATTPSPHLYTYSASLERRTGLKISCTSNVTTGTLSITVPQEIPLRAKTPRPLPRAPLTSINCLGRRGMSNDTLCPRHPWRSHHPAPTVTISLIGSTKASRSFKAGGVGECGKSNIEVPITADHQCPWQPADPLDCRYRSQ